MRKFKSLLYYDLTSTPFRYAIEKELAAYTDVLHTIFVNDDYPSEPSHREFEHIDALVTGVFDRFSDKLAHANALKYIGVIASDISDFIGIDLVKRGIILDTIAGYSTPAVAELTMYMMLSLLRFPKQRFETSLFIGQHSTIQGREALGKTIGIIGAGRIGTTVAQHAAAFGMTVVYYSRVPSIAMERIGARSITLHDLLGQSDVVSLHLTLNEQTQGIIGAEELALLKTDAIILNSARADLINLKALVHYREKNEISLWLDELSDATIRESLLKFDSTIITENLGRRTIECPVRSKERVLKNIANHLSFN
jgi:D-3-phosphoglycerate dehydrogenase